MTSDCRWWGLRREAGPVREPDRQAGPGDLLETRHQPQGPAREVRLVGGAGECNVGKSGMTHCRHYRTAAVSAAGAVTADRSVQHLSAPAAPRLVAPSGCFAGGYETAAVRWGWVVHGMPDKFAILAFPHFRTFALSHSHTPTISHYIKPCVRLHDPPARRREGGRGQGRLRMPPPLRPPRSFWYNSVIQPQGSAEAERGPRLKEPGPSL